MTSRPRARPLAWPNFCKKSHVLTWTSSLTKALWAGLLLTLAAFPVPGWGLDAYWGSHPRKERLVLRFKNSLPDTNVTRTGPQHLTLNLPPSIWSGESRPEQPDFSNAEHFQTLQSRNGKLHITTRAPEFGFLHFTLPDQNKLVIDVFTDQLGKQWAAERNQTGSWSDLNATTGNSPVPPEPAPSGSDSEPMTVGQEAAQAESQSSDNVPDQARTLRTDPEQLKPGRPSEPAADQLTTSQGPRFRSEVTWDGRAAPPGLGGHPQSLPEPDRPLQQVSQSDSDSDRFQQTGTHIITRKVTTAKPQPDPPESQNSASAQKQGNATRDAGLNTESNQTSQAQNSTDLSRSISTMMAEGKAALANGKWQAARSIFEKLVSDPRTSQTRRAEVLHNLADAVFSLYQDTPGKHYDAITSALEEAINADPESSQAPLALLRLCKVNLKVGNVPEARGYFNVLKRSFPQSRHVPTGHLYWGDFYLQRKDYEQAAEHYRAIVEKTPQSSAALPATAGLITSLKDLEFYDQAWTMVEYLRNRWPDYPLKNPELLRLSGLVAKETGRSSQARDLLWRYCNLKPDSLQEDLTLTRIGDIYLQMGQTKDARKMYQKVVSRYPEQQGGLIAKMRLAEEGINDQPSFTKMASVFDRPYNLRPVKVYQDILQNHPHSPLAPLAQLKLAMWHVWNESYDQALRVVSDFEKAFADSQLLPRVQNVGQKALKPLIMQAVQTPAYDRALELWDTHPFLHETADPETRIAVALSLWKQDDFEQALDMATPYLKRTDLRSASESAVELVLNIHLANSSWRDILEVSRTLRPEKLSPALQNQLTYSRALAHQKLLQEDKARPLWEDVVNMEHVSNLQQGFAFYFLAEQAMQDNDWENVYILAQKAFRQLQTSDQATAKALDSLDMLVHVTRRSGRVLEALEWAHRYEDLLSPDAPDWPAAKYKLANLYRQNGFLAKWEKNLQELSSDYPQTLYGEMAASDLSEDRLQKQAQAFFDQ